MDFTNLFNQRLNADINTYLESRTANQQELSAEKLQKMNSAMLFSLKEICPEMFEKLPVMAAFQDNFGDQASLDLFVQELSYLLLRQIDGDFANNHLSPFPKKDVMDLFLKQKEQFKPDIPMLNFPDLTQAQYQLATTFVFRQYAYDVPDREHGKFEVAPGEIVFNCGACMGDSTIWFYQEGAEKVYSFEPMPVAFNFLQQNLVKMGHPTEYSVNAAVGNKNQHVYFKEDRSHIGASHEIDAEEQSQLSKEQSDKLNIRKAFCFKLDDWSNTYKIYPTYIKMDLEGAEQQALEGAAQIITEYKPKLAICLYHKIEDMWVLPTLIKSYNPDYKFYCKKSNSDTEFVLFAV